MENWPQNRRCASTNFGFWYFGILAFHAEGCHVPIFIRQVTFGIVVVRRHFNAIIGAFPCRRPAPGSDYLRHATLPRCANAAGFVGAPDLVEIVRALHTGLKFVGVLSTSTATFSRSTTFFSIVPLLHRKIGLKSASFLKFCPISGQFFDRPGGGGLA